MIPPLTDLNYFIYDSETNILNKGEGAIGKSQAAPWSPRNKIVCYGYLQEDKPIVVFPGVNPVLHRLLQLPAFQLASPENPIWFVGHNVKFDLHYIRKNSPNLWYQFVDKVRIWDSQTIQYLLTGQQHKWSSLDELSVLAGGEGKLDFIKENYWNKGIDTADIPPEELIEYQEGDVIEQHRVFLWQYEQVLKNPGIYNLIISQMEAYLAIQEMEFNGMFFDKERAFNLGMQQQEIVDAMEEELNNILRSEIGLKEPNCNSTQQISVYLFGGECTETIKVPDLDDNGVHKKFKSGLKKGELRYKNTEVVYKYPGNVKPQGRWLGKNGFYSTAEGVMKTVMKSKNTPDNIKRFCQLSLDTRTLEKDINTYFVGFHNLTWQDNCIHGQLNSCATNTGRLSSSKPNLQNLTNKDED